MSFARGHLSRPAALLFLLAAIGVRTASALPTWIQEPPAPTWWSSSPWIFDSTRDRILVAPNVGITADNAGAPSWAPAQFPSPPAGNLFYDPILDRAWCFSDHTIARAGDPGTPGKLYALDLSLPSPVWTQVTYAGTDPFSRSGATLFFDSARHRLLLWGGTVNSGSPGTYLNDLYVLDLSGTPTWSSPAQSVTRPSAREGANAVYDPLRDRMIFFGGGRPIPSFNYSAETWALALDGSWTWTLLPPRGDAPPARGFAELHSDAASRRAILIGGWRSGDNAVLNDAWALDLSNGVPSDSAAWIPLPSPPALRDQPIAWVDSIRSRLIRFEGSTAGGEHALDAWSLLLAPSPTWSHPLPDSLSPPAQAGHFGFYDSGADRWYVGVGADNALWTRPTTTNGGWERKQGYSPLGFFAAAAFDGTGPAAYVLGGSDSSTPNAVSSETPGLHSPDLAVPGWTSRSSIPGARADALMVLDSSRRKFIVQGGRYSSNGHIVVRDDTWSYDIASDTWTQLPAGSYGGRWSQSGIYDPVRDRIVVFGGRDTTLNRKDVHVLSLGPGGTWAPLATSGTAPFASRMGSVRAAYDPVGDRMLVLSSESNVMRLFELTLGDTPTWNQLSTSGFVPTGRENYAFAWDPAHRVALMAQGALVTTGLATSESWTLHLDVTTPALASLVSSTGEDGLVRVVWQLAPGTGSVLAERADGGGWRSLGGLDADGMGRVELRDDDVVRGSSYDYRIRTVDGGVLGQTRVLVPSADRLSLAGAFPNPSPGSVRARFTLASKAPATLELFDVQGKRIARRDLATLGAGEHTLLLAGPEGSLAPGLYFLKLSQGRDVRAARVAVIR